MAEFGMLMEIVTSLSYRKPSLKKIRCSQNSQNSKEKFARCEKESDMEKTILKTKNILQKNGFSVKCQNFHSVVSLAGATFGEVF